MRTSLSPERNPRRRTDYPMFLLLATILLPETALLTEASPPATDSMSGLFNSIKDLSGTAVIIAMGYLVYTGKIVTRREFDAVCKDRDDWKVTTLRSIQNNERFATSAERSADLTARVVKANTNTNANTNTDTNAGSTGGNKET